LGFRNNIFEIIGVVSEQLTLQDSGFYYLTLSVQHTDLIGWSR